METVAAHVIESEVAAPPPRRTRLPVGTDLLLLAATLLFALFIYGGARALLESWKIGWLAMAGRTVSGRVQQVLTEPSPGKDRPPTQTGLRYLYTLPTDSARTLRWGTVRLETHTADEARGPQGTLPGAGRNNAPSAVPVFRVGDTLPLRCAAWFGKPLVYPWQAAPTGRVVFLALCGGLVVAVSALLLRRILRWRGHRLGLLRRGIATTGTIVHREARAEDVPRYFIRYGYKARSEPLQREEQVSLEQWKRLDVGQPVTVLYDPDRPDDASLYVLIGTG